MGRCVLVVVIALGVLCAPVAAMAQGEKSGKIARIGRLSPLSAETDAPGLDAFRPYTGPFLRERESLARALGVRLQVVEAQDPSRFEPAFAEMVRERAGALMVFTDVMFVTHRRRLVELAAKNRLPAVYPEREFVSAGGLMFYGASLADMYYHAASYAEKILKGSKPAYLPVEQPTKLDQVINRKTAKTLGLVIPSSVLARADHVVE